MSLKSTQYSEKVLDHFRNPRNVGTLEGDDVAVGRVGNPICGDLMEIYIRVVDDRINEIKFRTFGCGSAIATSSMITEMVQGLTLDEAMQVSRKDVAEELEGLPPIKMHCSNLAADALHAAIAVWRGEAPPPREDVLANLTGIAIEGENEYLGKGFFVFVDDLSIFAGKRVLVVYTGDKSVATAIDLTEQTGRVVLATPMKRIKTAESELQRRLDPSDVKVLYESVVIALKGFNEVEKVEMHNLAEDEKYELFADAVIKLALDSNVSGGACELPPGE